MPQRVNTYFISDLHLGAKYIANPREAELNVVRFLEHIKNDAKEIYLVGDILDYWFEYRYVVPRGHIRFLGKLAELADTGIKITWLIGNHDIWIFDYLPNELGITIIDGHIQTKINDKNFFISHGDGLGKLPTSFKIIRTIFRNKICQRLYSAIHPRWTIPFALGWSKSSRKQPLIIPPYKGKENESLIKFAIEHHNFNTNINFYVFGHRHLMIDEQISDSCRVIILGEWINTFSYAIFDGNDLKLAKWNFK